MVDAPASSSLWESVRSLVDFWRYYRFVPRASSVMGFSGRTRRRTAVQPGAGGVALAVAGAFAVLFLPYSLLGPFAGALLDRWGPPYGAGATLLPALSSPSVSRPCWPWVLETFRADRCARRQRIQPVRHFRPVGGIARRCPASKSSR